jgi:hypothetical protein
MDKKLHRFKHSSIQDKELDEIGIINPFLLIIYYVHLLEMFKAFQWSIACYIILGTHPRI